MTQRAHAVVVAGSPVLFHGKTRKLVVLGVALVVRRPQIFSVAPLSLLDELGLTYPQCLALVLLWSRTN